MFLEIITKRKLDIINRKKLRYPLAIAEKDYFLALVSKIIFNSKIKEKLIFKGGTALHHVYLPQLRFSEDLDFSTNSQAVSIDDLQDIFSEFDFLSIKKFHVSKATVKIEKLQYLGPLAQPNSLKIEVDFLQNVVLPPKKLEYKNVYGVKTRVKVMDIREIAAEKIRAMSDRLRYRDFYDLFYILKEFDLNLKEIKGIMKVKEIRKPISDESILKNWQILKKEKARELEKISYTVEVQDKDIEKIIKSLKVGVIN